MADPEFPADFPDANDELADTPIPSPPDTGKRARPKFDVIPSFDRLVKTRAPSADERMPPNDLEVEKAALALALIDQKSFETMRGELKPGDFFSGACSVIYDAMLNVEGRIDPLTVGHELKKSGRLAQVGGMAALTELHTQVGITIANAQSYIAVIKGLSRQRALLFAAHRTVAQLYDRTGQEAISIAAELRIQIEQLEEETRPAGIQFVDAAEMFKPQPKADLVIPKLGLAPGPVTGIFGQGYSGKSVSTFSMGLSVATGRDVWGSYTCKRGTWVHLDYEQGQRRVAILVQRLTRGMGLWKDDVIGHFKPAIFPNVNLTTPRAYDYFCRAFEGATIVTADALKGMTPGIDENSSEIRDYMQILSRASAVTGALVCLVHHAGKTKEHEKPRKEAGRGSIAIFDECANVFVMSAEKGKPARVTHEKERELGFLLDDFGLAIEDVPTDDGNPRGGLRVRELCWQELAAQEKRENEGKARFNRIEQAVLDCVKQTPGIVGIDGIVAVLQQRRDDVRAAVNTLLERGALTTRPGRTPPTGGKPPTLYYLPGQAPLLS